MQNGFNMDTPLFGASSDIYTYLAVIEGIQGVYWGYEYVIQTFLMAFGEWIDFDLDLLDFVIVVLHVLGQYLSETLVIRVLLRENQCS